MDLAADIITCLLRSKDNIIKRRITAATFAADIYNIWRAQNLALSKNQILSAQQTVKTIKEQVRHKILFLNKHTCTY